jgi:hypothetical protein
VKEDLAAPVQERPRHAVEIVTVAICWVVASVPEKTPAGFASASEIWKCPRGRA